MSRPFTAATDFEQMQVQIENKKRVLIDAATGKKIEATVIKKRVYGKKLYLMSYLSDYLAAFGIIKSKQLDVFVYIISHTDLNTHLFIGRIKAVAEATGVSVQKVNTTFARLKKSGYARRVQAGLWEINPILLPPIECEEPYSILTTYTRSEILLNQEE